MHAVEVRYARQWRSYEQGITDVKPTSQRPGWLPTTEATRDQERVRRAEDPDAYQLDPVPTPSELPATPPAVSPEPPTPAVAKRRPSKRPWKGPRMQHFNVDVPVPLKGANCADMPSDLVEKYFNADVLRQAAAAQVAMVVCSHCAILDTCFNRALNGSNVRESGVIAGMGARELKRGRLWRRHEQGATAKVPTTERPDWLPRTAAADQFELSTDYESVMLRAARDRTSP